MGRRINWGDANCWSYTFYWQLLNIKELVISAGESSIYTNKKYLCRTNKYEGISTTQMFFVCVHTISTQYILIVLRVRARKIPMINSSATSRFRKFFTELFELFLFRIILFYPI